LWLNSPQNLNNINFFMKHFYICVAVLLSMVQNFNAQNLNYPPSFDLGINHLHNLPIEELGTLNSAEVEEEDNKVEAETGRYNNGRIIFSKLDAESNGTWTELENGGRLWQLRFRTSGALGVSVYFDDLFLPIGSMLYLYSADQSNYQGPYDHAENSDHGIFVIGEVYGQEAVLEYYEPSGVIETPRLGIRGFGHLYRGVYNYGDMRGGGSDPCEVDVNCPEGADWQPERDAAVRLQLVDNGSLFLCSGSLVNNTAMDCKNYILSAMHCTIGISASDLLSCQLRFNYERSGCGSGSAVSTHNKSGVIKRGDSADNGGDTGSDYVLLEMEDEIPDSWNPFYAGWDATGATPNSGVSIHHPNGDVKKISTSEDIVSGTWPGGASGHHWRLEWMETVTEWGVTEGGSSGSPFYNQNHQIVGTLTGGGSLCESPTSDDYYGKFSRHWDGNPNPASSHLETWLNPEPMPVQLTMFGSYRDGNLAQPCSVGIDEQLMFDEADVYPSPAKDFIMLSSGRYSEIKEVRIYNNDGQMVDVVKMMSMTHRVDVKSYPSGIYFVSFVLENGNYMSKKITKI
jgi:hypothetical protein